MRLPAWLICFAVLGLSIVACGDDSDDVAEPSATEEDGVALEGIEPSVLESLRIRLDAVTVHEPPPVSAEEAEATARIHDHADAHVREVVLARLYDTTESTADGVVVWVINYDPQGEEGAPRFGPGEAEDTELQLALSFVDATTGEWLYSAEVSGPSED
jgi:hypothetical protein